FPAIRSCHGTEPFWSLSLDTAGSVTFATPEAEPQTGKVRSRWTSLNRRDRHGFSARIGAADYVGLVGRSACSDGMSDMEHGLAVDLLLDGDGSDARLLSGCCSLAP
ncbi:MAG: peptide-binding protein, partial [Albidovulum sp.]